MYQGAFCLPTGPEVSEVSREAEGDEREPSSRRRGLVCAVCFFERSPWIRMGHRRSRCVGMMGKALICLRCAAETSPRGYERIKAAVLLSGK